MSAKDIIVFLERFHGRRVALITHLRPDGDAAGSAIGLATILRDQGYAAKVITPLPLPTFLRFLDHDGILAHPADGWWREFDCLGVLDCGDEARLDAHTLPAITAIPTCTIDHHASSQGFGEARWIDPHASAAGEMVVRLAGQAGWAIPPHAAQALWTALITDTGRFCHENTTPAAIEAAGVCLRAGADPAAAATELYQSVSPEERCLQTIVLDRMEITESGRLATAWIERADFSRAGIGAEGAQNLINLLRDTRGVEVAVFFYEPPDASVIPGVKVSMRTAAPRDALAVVSQFGGGGHHRAAGCSLDQPMDEARRTILAAVRDEYFS